MRNIWPETSIHPAVRDKVSNLHKDIVEEVQRAVQEHAVVIVGMAQNPHPRKARQLLDARKIPYRYLEYGSYLKLWRRRNALKMWTGWPTFPMIWVKGVFIGGASDLAALLSSGEFDQLMAV